MQSHSFLDQIDRVFVLPDQRVWKLAVRRKFPNLCVEEESKHLQGKNENKCVALPAKSVFLYYIHTDYERSIEQKRSSKSDLVSCACKRWVIRGAHV